GGARGAGADHRRWVVERPAATGAISGGRRARRVADNARRAFYAARQQPVELLAAGRADRLAAEVLGAAARAVAVHRRDARLAASRSNPPGLFPRRHGAPRRTRASRS